MGKKGLEKVKDDLKQVGEDLEEFAREEKNKITGHDPHDDVKKELSHDDKAEDFEASTGITSEGRWKVFLWSLNAACVVSVSAIMTCIPASRRNCMKLHI